MAADDRPGGRRFWTAEDVIAWVDSNVRADCRSEGASAAALWWCCYRNTEALIDDTVRHIAQALMDGVGPFYEDDVTDMVQNWGDTSLDEGDVSDAAAVDAEIEKDLTDFFLKGR